MALFPCHVRLLRLSTTAIAQSTLFALLAGGAHLVGPGSVAAASPAPAPAASLALADLVEAYYQAFLELHPLVATENGDHRFDDRIANDIGPAHRSLARALEESSLAEVEAISPAELDEADLLTWEVFRAGRLQAIEAFEYPEHLLPISQVFSVPDRFAQMGSGAGIHPFETVRDYENWLSRSDDLAIWVDQAITNMRDGIARGVVQPRCIVEAILRSLGPHAEARPGDCVFRAPIEEFPEGVGPADRVRLAAAFADKIQTTILPAFRRLHAFVEDEYLPKARETTGFDALPGGRDWYAYLVRAHTTTDLTPQEIHDLGLREVARITARMEEIAAEVGYPGGANGLWQWFADKPEMGFASETELLECFRRLAPRVDAHVRELFATTPNAPLEIRPVEPFRQHISPFAYYDVPSPDGSRPGVFYVNTGGWEWRTRMGTHALFLHEAVPGHHFQIALQRELTNLPNFRRFAFFTAYIEGWGLYAETLGSELGLYDEAAHRFGALGSERFRARRLVVDTGLHALGWSRQQAINYMFNNVGEVDRYIAWPGQALSYKVGELKLLELRRRAEQRLGDRFDVLDFHQELLKDGALPLDTLERKMERWMAAREG